MRYHRLCYTLHMVIVMIALKTQKEISSTHLALALDLSDDVFAGFQTPSQYARMLIELGVNNQAISEGIRFALKKQFKYAH